MNTYEIKENKTEPPTLSQPLPPPSTTTTNTIITTTTNTIITATTTTITEAWYHEFCRKTYTRKPQRNLPKFSSEKDKMDYTERKRHQSEEEEGHSQAFEYLCQYIKEHIIEKAHVVKISYLKELYCTYMQNHHPNHYNKNYKTDKLKSKLIAFFIPEYHFGNDMKALVTLCIQTKCQWTCCRCSI